MFSMRTEVALALLFVERLTTWKVHLRKVSSSLLGIRWREQLELDNRMRVQEGRGTMILQRH
jgi:hypothetical protein